jgi:predicted helicase
MTKSLADVYHLDIYGLRKDKYQTLLDNSISTLPWQRIECRAPEYFFVVKDFSSFEEYDESFSVNELFLVQTAGIVTHRDGIVIGFNKSELKNQIVNYLAEISSDNNFSTEKIRKITYRPFDDRAIYYDTNLVVRHRREQIRHSFYENYSLLLGRQTKNKEINHFFITSALSEKKTAESSTGSNHFPLYLYPEATGQQSLQKTSVRQPNLNSVILQQIAEKLGLTFTPEKSTVIPAGIGGGDSISSSALSSSMKVAGIQRPEMGCLDIPVTGYPHPGGYDAPLENVQTTEIREPGDKNVAPVGFAPIDLLDYIYAVLHSPNYRLTYKEFLKTDFPRVPYPDPHTFWQLVKLGGELRQLHLLDNPVINNPITTYPMDGDNIVARKINQNDFTVRPEPVEGLMDDVHGSTSSPRTAKDLTEPVTETIGRVWINDTQYFDGVPAIAWEFYIGGYQPAQKWLKDRHGRTLSFEDILHYQKIIVALSETHRIMQAIDAV